MKSVRNIFEKQKLIKRFKVKEAALESFILSGLLAARDGERV